MLPQIVRDNKPERCDRTDFNDPPSSFDIPIPPQKLFLHDRTIARSKVERVIFYERNATISKKMEYLNFFVDERKFEQSIKLSRTRITRSKGRRFIGKEISNSFNLFNSFKMVKLFYMENMIDSLCNKGQFPIVPCRGLKGFGVGVMRDKVNVFTLYSIQFNMESNIC